MQEYKKDFFNCIFLIVAWKAAFIVGKRPNMQSRSVQNLEFQLAWITDIVEFV